MCAIMAATFLGLRNFLSFLLYDTPVERPAFGLSDHSSVEVQPKQRVKTSQTIQTVISRDLRPSNRVAMQTYLYEVDVTAMIRAMTTCEGKVSMSISS